MAGGRGGRRSGIIGRPGADIGPGAGADGAGAGLGAVAAAGAKAGASGRGETGSDNWAGCAAGLASAGLPAGARGAGDAFGLISAGLTDTAFTDAALAATGCFSVTFATGVALAAAGGGRFARAGVGLATFAGAVGCFIAAGRAGLAEVAIDRRGAGALARKADAPLPFIALPADAFMSDTFNLCPSNVVNRRLVNAARITYPTYATPL